MNTMDRFCRVIALFLLVSFVSCTSTPYAINLPQLALLQAISGAQQPSSQQAQPLGSAQTAQPHQLVSPLPQYQFGGGSDSGFQAVPTQATVPQSSYWTGDGGRGKSRHGSWTAGRGRA